MVQVFVGTNAFQINRRVRELTDAFVEEHGDLALEKIDASEVTYEQILGAVESQPFLAARKMVVVREVAQNNDAAEKLDILIERAGDDTDLIIVEGKLDKRAAYYKELKKLSNFEEHNETEAGNVTGWVKQQAELLGGEITEQNARYLVDRVGANQMKLSNELTKLVLFDPKVTRQTIDKLTDENPATTVFNLIDAAFSGNLKRALHLYDEQRQQRVEPQAIHAMLVWQLHAVAVAATAPKDLDPRSVAVQSGLNPFVLQKSQRIAQRMGRADIHESLKLLRDIDYKSKRQTIDYDEAIQYAIVRFAEMS